MVFHACVALETDPYDNQQTFHSRSIRMRGIRIFKGIVATIVFTLISTSGRAVASTKISDMKEGNMLSKQQMREGMSLKLIAPGIWRLRFGKPERFTPMRYSPSKPNEKGLADMPPCSQPPFPLSGVQAFVNGHGCCVEIPMTDNERIYGFGINSELFNMNNRRVFIRASDSPENDLNDSHAAIPFYVSNNGYGVFVDTARYATFYTGDASPRGRETEAKEGFPKTLVADVPEAKGVDIYVIGGPTMMDAVRRYNLLSGGGCLPPLWGLGVEYRCSADFDAEQALALAKSFRDQNIPCDVWGLEPGWQSHAYPCSFMWSKERYPDPGNFIKSLHSMGYHLSLWEHAFTDSSSPLYPKLERRSANFRVWGGLVPDFASKETRTIFGDYHRKTFVDEGVDTFKLDECDNQPDSSKPWSFPECSSFPSGIDGEAMHNLFGELYQRAILYAFKNKNLRTFGLVRSSGALASSLPFAIYSDSYNLQDYVRALAKCGFGGLLWTPEVRDASSVEDLYRRIETVILSPQALINCWYMKNPPWLQINREKSNQNMLMSDHEEVTAGVRKLLQLRMSLIPYLYSAFAAYHYEGIPPFRAVVMDYPNDPNTWELDNQFMVGPSLMAAPLFTGEKSRQVYLPKGVWYDFWTHERYEGGQSIEVTEGLDRIPLYVKNDSLLPMAEPVENVQQNTCFHLTVNVFGNHPSPFVLYEDDGVTNDYLKGDQNQIVLRWKNGKGSFTRTGNYTGPTRYAIGKWVVAGN
jgi:alpha-D-xyloside xylohydrolase